jgi:hypothetical protein
MDDEQLRLYRALSRAPFAKSYSWLVCGIRNKDSRHGCWSVSSKICARAP